MTPFEISILMHYQVSTGDFRNGDFSAPSLRPTLEALADAGLLARTKDDATKHYRSTEATAVYVEALCAVPAPVQEWIIPTYWDLTPAGKAHLEGKK